MDMDVLISLQKALTRELVEGGRHNPECNLTKEYGIPDTYYIEFIYRGYFLRLEYDSFAEVATIKCGGMVIVSVPTNTNTKAIFDGMMKIMSHWVQIKEIENIYTKDGMKVMV